MIYDSINFLFQYMHLHVYHIMEYCSKQYSQIWERKMKRTNFSIVTVYTSYMLQQIFVDASFVYFRASTCVIQYKMNSHENCLRWIFTSTLSQRRKYVAAKDVGCVGGSQKYRLNFVLQRIFRVVGQTQFTISVREKAEETLEHNTIHFLLLEITQCENRKLVSDTYTSH